MMRRAMVLKVVICWIALLGAVHGAEPAQIKKVLPHLLDLEGRHSLSPSLYERDAYQHYLRNHPEQQSALRYDIHWRARRGLNKAPLVLRLEIRTSKGQIGKPLVFERTLKPRWSLFGNWTSLTISGEEFKALGDVIAWRASLWSETNLLTERRSFLW